MTRLLLIFTGLSVLWKLLNNQEKAEELKKKFVEAKTKDDVDEAVYEALAGTVSEVLDTDIPAGVFEGLVEAQDEAGVDNVLDRPEVRGGLFDLAGKVVVGVLGGIGALIGLGKK